MADAPAVAQDGGALARQAGDTLRKTESLAFRDKEGAFAKLPEIGDLIEQLRAADPQHSRLRSLDSQFKRLVKDLERKTGQTYGEAAAAPAPKKAAAPKPAAPKAQTAKPAASGGKLPSSVTYRLEQLEKELANGEKQVDTGKAERAERYANNAEKKLDDVLGKVDDENHPRIVSAIERVQALRAAVDEAKAGKMPSAVAGELKSVDERLTNAEQALAKPPEDSASSEERVMKTVAQHLDVAERRLNGAREESDNAGFDHAAHPQFAELDKRLADLRGRYDRRLATYEEGQAATGKVASAAEKDFTELGQMWEQVRERYVNSNTTDVATFANTEDTADAKERLALFQAFDEKLRDAVTEKLAYIRETYGEDRYAIDKTARAGGYDGKAGSYYAGLSEMLDQAAEFRLAAADKMSRVALQHADWVLNTAHDFFFRDGEARALDAAGVARGFAAGMGDTDAMLADLQKQIDAAVAERWRRIDERTWPGHGNGAPADRDELAQVAFKWVADSPDWGSRAGNPEYKDQEPRRPVVVAVLRDWYVTDTDALGQPIQYGLPVLIGVELEREKPENLARAYELTLLGPKRKDPPRSPPFGDAWVGDSYYIRRDKLN
ncbi:MAG: hypothetical protein RIM84_04565 [Alphaproteobacteria bacterium]